MNKHDLEQHLWNYLRSICNLTIERKAENLPPEAVLVLDECTLYYDEGNEDIMANEQFWGELSQDEKDAILLDYALIELYFDKYLDWDIFYVEETANGKQLNVQRCYYANEDGLQCTEYTGIRENIPVDRLAIEENILNCQQYSGKATLDEFLQDIEDMKSLLIADVNDKTPCGKYIDRIEAK